VRLPHELISFMERSLIFNLIVPLDGMMAAYTRISSTELIG
jgi:hypothetical protein